MAVRYVNMAGGTFGEVRGCQKVSGQQYKTGPNQFRYGHWMSTARTNYNESASAINLNNYDNRRQFTSRQCPPGMPERIGPDLLARSPEDGQLIAYSPGLARSVLLGTLTSSRMRVCHTDNGVANLIGYERFMYLRSAFVLSFLTSAERAEFTLSGQSPGTFRHSKYANEWEAYLASHVSKLTAWQRAAMGPQSIIPYLVEGATGTRPTAPRTVALPTPCNRPSVHC